MVNNAFMQQHQKLLAWGLFTLVLLVVVFFAVLPALQTSAQLREQIDNGYKQLQRFRQLAVATPELMQEYQRVQANGLDKLFYPEGMTAAQVAKELQNHLSTVIVRGGGTVNSSEVLDAAQQAEQPQSVYQQVMVKAVFQGSPSLLREVLHQAYEARPLMFVERLDIKPVEAADAKQQVLRAEIQVSTYWRGGEVQREQAEATD